MRKIYNISSDKIINNTKIALLSDWHIENEADLERIKNKVMRNFISFKPDYIFILGDLINDANISNSLMIEITYFLSMLNNIAPVYAILGNHDELTSVNGKWQHYINEELLELYRKNINLVENKSVTLDEGITFTGINLGANYYEEQQEDPNYFIDEMYKFILNLGNDTYNILAHHSPNNLFDVSVQDKIAWLKKVNLFLAAHNHNGLIPSYLDFLPTNRGIMSYQGSQLKLFMDNCRGKKVFSEDQVGIIASPMTTFSVEKLIPLNAFYPAKEQYIVLNRKLKK